ncbi:uncharacterized protein LOC110337817 [Mus pahari]|uniref:uncharacterized protein LOC110337817 n=1 Tax=Mus pahari TaxID=10093 RepID=UPI000A30E04D|nr:uncharacterized protein LOC110337817 [Mus pahari]
MNPASTRRGSSGDGSRRSTSRPGVSNASSLSASQVYVASAAPSVPGTPTSQDPSVPGTPSRQQSFIRAIPSSQRPSVHAIPSSQRPSVRALPSRQRPSVRALPSRQRPSVRALPSRQRPSVRIIPSGQRPLVRGTSYTRSLQSVHRDRIADRVPKKYSQHEKMPPPRLVQGSKKIKIPEAVKTQAEGHDRHSKRNRDSFWHFCCSANGMLKVLRMCITAASVFFLIIGGARELFVVIMIQETCIVLFFIIIYLVTLQDTMACIHWPLLDLINSAISTVFLGTVGILVIGERNTKDLCYAGGILCLSAAVLCVIDALLFPMKRRNKAKTSLSAPGDRVGKDPREWEQQPATNLGLLFKDGLSGTRGAQ